MTVTRRGAVAALLVVLALPAAWALRGLSVDNRLERWTGDDAAGRAAYERFLRLFGSDEFVLAVIAGGDGLSPESLDLGIESVERIEGLPGVTAVQSPAQVYRDLFGAEDPEAVAREMTATPFYRDLLVSRDASATAILVRVAPTGGADARAAIVAGTRRALAPFSERGFDVHLVGSTVLSAALDRISVEEARRAFPLAVAGSLLILAVLLGSLRTTAVAAACAALALVLTFGLVAATGRGLNMVTAALPPLLWVLALGNIVHLLRRYRTLAADGDRTAALERALHETRRGCVLAAVTTAAGFVSLVAAPLQPVRELGLFAAVGILISLVVNLTLGPVLIARLRPGGDARPRRAGSGARPPFGVRRPRTVVAAAATLAVAALALLPRIEVAGNPISFLPADHPVTRDYRAVAGSLGGFYTLEVVLDLPRPWSEPAAAEVIEQVADHLRDSPVVARVITPVDLLRQLNAWESGTGPGGYEVPSTGGEGERLLAGLDADGRELLATLVAGDGRTVHVSAIVNEMDEQLFLGLVEAAREELERLPEGWSGSVTGQVLELVRSQQRLVSTQLRSLGLALAFVFLALHLGLRSWRLTTLSLAPNLAPLLAAFALMALLGFPLDPATAMVASIALGIAVDNTAHMLEAVRRLQFGGMPRREAAAEAVRRTGPAMTITATTAVVGFLALLVSDFVPIAHFGALAAAAMAVALAADAVLLPATLALWRRP